MIGLSHVGSIGALPGKTGGLGEGSFLFFDTTEKYVMQLRTMKRPHLWTGWRGRAAQATKD